MAKFKDMNKKQLNKKQTELTVELDALNDELELQKVLLDKVCKIADFDADLAIFTKKQLKELGIKKPEVIDVIGTKIVNIESEISQKEGMLKAVEYYKNGGQ